MIIFEMDGQQWFARAFLAVLAHWETHTNF